MNDGSLESRIEDATHQKAAPAASTAGKVAPARRGSMPHAAVPPSQPSPTAEVSPPPLSLLITVNHVMSRVLL